MNVFELLTEPKRYSNFALAYPLQDGGIYDVFDGRSLAAEWKAPVVIAADEDQDAAEFADFALLGTVPVFSLQALEALLDLLRPNGEVLPLRFKGGEYFAYNVTRILPALDETASSMTRFSTGRVMSIDRYVFRPELLDNAAVFKIPELPKAFVFVTDAFVERIRATRLTGLVFSLLWHSLGSGSQACEMGQGSCICATDTMIRPQVDSRRKTR